MGQLRDFAMPDLGEGLESGEIVAWHVEVGDHVELNQEICEIETAKAVISVPCPFAGTVVERFGEVGEELAVGQPLIRVDVETNEAAGRPEGGEGVLVGYGAAEPATRRRRGGRRSRGAAGDGQGSTRDAGEAAEPAAASAGAEPSPQPRPLATPPVRKLARDLGVDLAAIAPGSGPRGAITREDVRLAAAARRPAPATPPAAREAAAIGFRGRHPGEVLPLRGIRKRIAARMTEAGQRIPAASCSVTVDCTELWRLRERLTEVVAADGAEARITALVLVLRAVVLGLRRFPTLNAVLDEEAGEIRLLEPVHLGVAADTQRGLLVPVIKHADTRTTLELARELARLTAAARDGSIAPAELTGGTFTVTNYGAFGADDGNPLINHPEAAILGVGAMQERPWVVDGQLAVRRVVKLTCAFDHRISDGGEAGRFVTYLGELVEEPARILLHA